MFYQLVRQAIALLSGHAAEVAQLKTTIASLEVQLLEARAAVAESIPPEKLQAAQEALFVTESEVASLKAEELAEDATEAELVAALSALIPSAPEPVAE